MTKPQRQRLRSPETAFEREFLKLAGTYLACRLEVMGGRVDRNDLPPGTHLRFSLLGMSDHSGEMRLMCQEALEGHRKSSEVEIGAPPLDRLVITS